jgi:hypothetical protein
MTARIANYCNGTMSSPENNSAAVSVGWIQFWRFRLGIKDLANRGRQVLAAKRLLDQFHAGIEAALMNDSVS